MHPTEFFHQGIRTTTADLALMELLRHQRPLYRFLPSMVLFPVSRARGVLPIREKTRWTPVQSIHDPTIPIHNPTRLRTMSKVGKVDSLDQLAAFFKAQ